MKFFRKNKATKWLLISLIIVVTLAFVALGIHVANSLRSSDDDITIPSTDETTVNFACAHSITYDQTEYGYHGHTVSTRCMDCDALVNSKVLAHTFENRICTDTACNYECDHFYTLGTDVAKDGNVTWTSENDNTHIVSTLAGKSCLNCGYSGTYVEDHNYDVHGVCVACDQQCSHEAGAYTYEAVDEYGLTLPNVHAKKYYCSSCGMSNVIREDCTYNPDTGICEKCNISCPHPRMEYTWSYTDITETHHRELTICDACKYVIESETQEHYYSAGQDGYCPCGGVSCDCSEFEIISYDHDWMLSTGLHHVLKECKSCHLRYNDYVGTRIDVEENSNGEYYYGYKCSECDEEYCIEAHTHAPYSCGLCDVCGYYAEDSTHAQTAVGETCPVCSCLVKSLDEE